VMNVETKLGLDVFKIDSEPHILINQEICRSCEEKFCLYVCPGKLYSVNRETGDMEIECSGCLECGTCQIACIHGALDWNYARGGFGIQYRFG
jgi:ferredoxin like protein